MASAVEQSVSDLLSYITAEGYAGYDPYDGLGSPLVRFLANGTRGSSVTRLVWMQAVRALPWNMRSWLGVPKERNPKGIALFVRALLELARVQDCAGCHEEAQKLLEWLRENRVPGFEGYSWSYNFDWQSRAFYAPRGTPNAICTIFVAEAFLDAYTVWRDPGLLAVAEESCCFIEKYLIGEGAGGVFCRYIPGAELAVHNVNLLAAALLARTAGLGQGKERLNLAQELVAFSAGGQNEDGSWPYATRNGYRWVDNYHTAFNLVALKQYSMCSADCSVEPGLNRGYAFWDAHFLLPDGTPKYFHNRVYPIDVHCAAQAILTYLHFQSHDDQALSKAERTAEWAVRNMQSKMGYFYYQIRRSHVVRIPYMRWGQAWMLYALSRLLAVV